MARMLNKLLPQLFTPSDEQLIWRVQQQDDSGAFGELARRWEMPIRPLCERMTGDSHKAKDLVHGAADNARPPVQVHWARRRWPAVRVALAAKRTACVPATDSISARVLRKGSLRSVVTWCCFRGFG